jgi:hypothetical protein
MSTQVNNNALSVIALANEYCQAMELASTTEPLQFVTTMTRLLPRIYIAVNDVPLSQDFEPEYAFDAAHLEEAYYDEVRGNVSALMGENDAYLDTFHEDMKYSDTPIAATVSEGLADLFQVMYDFVEDVRDATSEQIMDHLAELRQTFRDYWSNTLCNVMRPLNQYIQNPPEIDE